MPLATADLLLGGDATYVVQVPAEVLRPGGADGTGEPADGGTVTLRPLRLADIQRIRKASEGQDALTGALMIQEALVEPAVKLEQVNRMHAGLVQFLLREINRVSGLSLSGDELRETVQAPLARACYTLAREFGWTPQECAQLTLGQILVYLEMIGRGETLPGTGP